MVTNERRLIADAERRTNRVWQADGLPEIGSGLFGIVFGASWLAEQLADWSGWTIVAVVLIGGPLTNRAVGAAKTRLSDRWVGYVRLRNDTWDIFTRYWFVVVLFVAAYSVVSSLGADAVPGWRFLADWWGLVFMAAGAVLGAVRQRTPGYAALALIPLAFIGSGEVGALAREAAFAWCIIILGLASLAIGLWRLRAFLRSHRTPAGT